LTYDLRRLRLAGLIRRIEHTNRYVLTPDGLKVTIFCTKVHNRLLRPLLAADQPQGARRTPGRPAHHRPARQQLHSPRPAGPSRVRT
jgi:hypothetical protein